MKIGRCTGSFLRGHFVGFLGGDDILDVLGDRLECLADVFVILGTGLEEGDSVVFCDLLPLAVLNSSFFVRDIGF